MSHHRLLAALLGSAVVCCAAPAAPLANRLLWDCETTGGVAGLELETGLVKQGRAAVRWRQHPQTPGFSVPNLPTDWTGYHYLRFQIHSAKAVPTRIMVVIGSENPATEGPDYWGGQQTLNFTGWREVLIPIGQPGGTRLPLGWDKITHLNLTADGWGSTPHPESDLVLDAFELVYDPPRPGPRLTDEQFFAALDLTRPDLAAVQRAVDQGDLNAAKQAFLQHLRDRRTPVWRFDWRDRPRTAPLQGGSPGWDYFATGFKIDWTGWKTITIPLKQFGASRSPIGWHAIDYLSFSATYGDRTPSTETRLVLDEVRLEGAQPRVVSDFETAADTARWSGLQPVGNPVAVGQGAGLWANLRSPGNVTCRDAPRDWTPYTALSLRLWSAQATGDHLTVIANSDTPDVSGAEAVMKHLQGGFHVGDDINWEINKLPPTDPAFTREWTYNLNRFGAWTTLGEAYWATGDERYAREWIAQMRDWVEDNPYPLSGTGNDTLTWRTIEAGIRTAGAWPTALYRFLGSPSLQPDDAVTFVKSWIEHAHHLMRITVEHPDHGGNWVTMECNGLGHLGLLLPECRDSALWLKTAVDRLSLELDRQVYPDGAQKELTTGYHQVSRSNFAGLQAFAKLNGADLPASYAQALERMYDYNLKVLMPDGTLPPLNDAGFTGVLGALREGFELYGREDFRWAATGGAEGLAPGYTSVLLPYAGWSIMRSGWAADDRYLLFESGPFGTGHQHEDKLSMVAWGLGRVLLTEGGTYSYDQSKYRRYVLGTWAHNTICVDGQGQRRAGLPATYETTEPLDNLWVSNEVFDAADGVYDHGYGPQREIVVAHERTVVFLKPDYWLVLDRLRGTGRHQYDILWNLNNQAAAQDPRTRAAWGTDAGVANLQVTPSPTPGLALEIVVGRDEPPLGFAPAARRTPVPCLDYQLTATGPVTIAWALTPFRGERPDVTVTTTEQAGGTVVQIQSPTGTDHVFLARRGEASHGEMAGQEFTAQVYVIREAPAGRRQAGGPGRG